MKLTPEQISQIREATDIVALVGESVQLKKRGQNFIGLCPFHNERTPSFNVREDKGIFKCFGCGKGGDVFTFVMEREGLQFPDAVKKLADRANIQLQELSDDDRRKQAESENLQQAIRTCAAYFFRALRSQEGIMAWQYLLSRGFTEMTLRKFGIGYAHPDHNAIILHAREKGHSIEQLEAVGVIGRSERGTYGRFRDRIMFPIMNVSGSVIGFGGRIYTEEQKKGDVAKYVNSPDSRLYRKSSVVYGLHQAKDAIRMEGSAIIVEGYADVLMLHQSGFTTAVSASGTSLTKDQLDLLKRFTSTITLVFDADLAGKNATDRGIELALAAGFDVDVVLLPHGEDPDSIIRNKGAKEFEKLLKNSSSFIETKARWFDERGELADAAKSAHAVRSIVSSIAKIPDQIAREFFVKRLADRFHISPQALKQALDEELGIVPKTRLSLTNSGTGIAAKAESVVPRFASDDPERMLLEATLAAPGEVCELVTDNWQDMPLILNSDIRALVTYLFETWRVEGEIVIQDVLHHFREDRPKVDLLIEASMRADASEYRQAALYAVRAIVRADVNRQLDQVREKIRATTSDSMLEELMNESHELAKRLEELKAA